MILCIIISRYMVSVPLFVEKYIKLSCAISQIIIKRVPMLLLSRLTNIMLLGSKEILFLAKAIPAWPYALESLALSLFLEARGLWGLWDMPTWSLNPSILDLWVPRTSEFWAQMAQRLHESRPEFCLSEGRLSCRYYTPLGPSNGLRVSICGE